MVAAVLILAGVVVVVLGVVTSSTTLTAIALFLGIAAVVVLLLPLGRRVPASATSATSHDRADTRIVEPIATSDVSAAVTADRATPRAEPAKADNAGKPTEPAKRAEPAKAGKAGKRAEPAKAGKAGKPTEPAKAGKGAKAVKPTEPDPELSVVLVVAGRHRFHRPECELLQGRETHRLSPEEAEEEGFTPCSRCAGTRASV